MIPLIWRWMRLQLLLFTPHRTMQSKRLMHWMRYGSGSLIGNDVIHYWIKLKSFLVFSISLLKYLNFNKRWNVNSRTRTTNILIAGDLNASRPYVYDWDKSPLRDKKYEWYIKDHVDTTATGTMAAYDRIIGYGKNIPQVVVPDSGRAFRYDEEISFCGEYSKCTK